MMKLRYIYIFSVISILYLTRILFAQSDNALMPGDIIYISVPGQYNMSHKYDVDPSGNLYIVNVGKVSVKGLTIEKLENILNKKLSTYLVKGKKVTVNLIKRTRYIQIVGGVRYPGWYRVPNVLTLSDLINTAGGLLPGVNISNIKLRRIINGKLKLIKISKSLILEPNDAIIVPYPLKYKEKVDKGDLLFISIPQRQAPGTVPSALDIVNLKLALTYNQIEVDENGYIYIPEYGHFYVDGKTPEEIKEMIRERLPKYMKSFAHIDVGIVKKKHYVEILGHVEKPGKYNIPESANIQEALSVAGGASDGAVMSDVMIRRRMPNGRTIRIKVNLYQFTITGDPRLLTPIHAEDVIFVPISSTFGSIKRRLMPWTPPPSKLEQSIKSKVSIFGGVNHPGVYDLIKNMNILDLLVIAGGARDDADLSTISIIRAGRIFLRYNLSKFLKGQISGEIPKLRPGDVVYVNFVRKVTYKPRSRIYVMGNVNRPGSYELYANMTVLQALAWAGGLNDWADADHIIIVRMKGGKQQDIIYNYEKGVKGRYPEVNIRLKENDVIIVP